jgi:hypothetical protein
MKRFLALVLIASLGLLTIGCEGQKGTTENKTETTTSQAKDGKTIESTTTTTTDTTKTTPSVTPGAAGKTTETAK